MTRKSCLDWFCTVLLVLAAPATWAQATSQFDLPAQSLAVSLRAIGRQASVNVLFDPPLVEGLQAPALKAQLTAEQAFTRLLAGSGLKVRFLDSKTAMVVSVAEKARNVVGVRPIADAKNPVESPVRLSQVDSGQPIRDADSQSSSGPKPEASSDLADSSRTRLDEVIVTGSHIRGVKNDTAPMLSLDRDYIERSGYSNMMQLVESLPMNFGGGASGSSETGPFGDAANSGQNLTRGTGFNLHGLGSVATLTLINGRRVAPAAQGQFVDVSTLPLAAIERVEILTDGASAVYGADAVAGVVNIILRKNFDGAETVAEFGKATRGGTSAERLSQTLGQSWQDGNALLVADFSKRDPLDARDRDYIVAAGGAPPFGPTYLLPKRTTESLVFNLNQSLPDNFELISNVFYSHEEVFQAQTDASATLNTSNPVTNAWSALLGLSYQPFGDWRFELDGTVARMETLTDFTFTDLPTNTIVFLTINYRDKFDMWSADFKGDGTLFTLPSGKVRLAMGGSYRKDKLHSDRTKVIPDQAYQLRAADQRNVTSEFAELFVPLIAKEQGFVWARRIDLSLAAREDDYSDFGSTLNPKAGLVWSPVDSLDIRASYGTSFRAPSVAEKALVSRGVQIGNTDVTGLDGSQVPIFFVAGSAHLSAEKSRNLSTGFTFRPVHITGAELSVNYFNIDYRGRISSPPFDGGMLFNRAEFGNLVTDLPSDAAAQDFLNSHLAAGDTFVDYLGTGAAGVRNVFYFLQQNAARTRIDGLDVNASYELRREVNTYDFNVNLSRINNIRTSLLSNTTPFDDVNTYERPLKTRLRGMATWLRGGWNGTAAVNYSNSYTNTGVLPREPIKAWATVDLNLSYDFGRSTQSRVLDGCKLSLSVSNVLDVNPPHASDPVNAMGFDVFNADAMGRYVTARISKRW